MGNILTALSVGERGEGRQQARHGSPAHDGPVGEEGVDGDRALAHVHEALRDADHEQTVGLLVVVARELSEHLRQPCIVCTRTYETHREDSVERDCEVVIVTVRGEDDSRDPPRSWQYASKCLLISSQ